VDGAFQKITRKFDGDKSLMKASM